MEAYFYFVLKKRKKQYQEFTYRVAYFYSVLKKRKKQHQEITL